MENNGSNKTAIIAGASGLTGGHLLEYLLEGDHYHQVKAIVREPLNIDHPKLQQIVVDFDDLQSHEEELVADDVFCCLGTTIKKAGSQAAFRKIDQDYPLDLARLTARQGATKYMLVSALGADKSSLVFYNKVKGQVEHDLKQIPFQAIHIMRPSLLLGDRKESRVGEDIGKVVFSALGGLMVGPLKRYRGIKAKAVAFGMFHLAQQPDLGVYEHESDEIQDIFDRHPQA